MVLSIFEIFVLVLIVFLTSIVTSITGFGGGIVGMPLFLQVFSLKFINPLFNLISLFNNFILIYPAKNRKSEFTQSAKINIKLLSLLLIGNLIGSIIGVFLLKQYYNVIFVNLIGVFIVLWEIKTLIEIIRKKQLDHFQNNSLKTNTLLDLVVGCISGTMSAVFGIGGPPLVIYLKNFLKNKEVIRSTLIWFFLGNGVMQVTVFTLNGLINTQMMLYSLICLPSLLLGSFVGSKISKNLPQEYYQIAISSLLIIAGSWLVFKT